ncbi:phage portal protein [Kitasatospora cineracea]|uniref:phage portal protein n=1 Tax=Kitasatospora cineracea TaxID=88074 RepID=UPI0036BB910D
MSVWWKPTRAPGPGTPARAGNLEQVMAQIRGSTSSYASVNLSRAESSLQAVAVFAATDLIASVASELPVDVYRGKGPERTEVKMPGYLLDPDGSGHGLPDWCYQAMMSWLLRGNLYGDVLQRGPGGVLQQVVLFHPDEVNPSLEDGQVDWTVNGKSIPSRDFYHRRVNPLPGVLLGLSPVRLLASTIGLSLTATKFGLQWFQDGGHPNALLVNSETSLDDDQARAVKRRFLASLRGNREPVVMGKGWDYKPLQVAPEESQFLQTQQYSQAECARIFGPGIAEILGYGSGSMTYANVVDRDISLLKYSVGRWLRRLERSLSEFLPRPQYVKFNRDALLETNTLARYQAHASALTNNWETINEVRALENKRPVAWGDAPFIPGLAEPAADPALQEE